MAIDRKELRTSLVGGGGSGQGWETEPHWEPLALSSGWSLHLGKQG